MDKSPNYFIVKDKNDYTITYLEFNKVQGYDLKPRNIKIKDAIDVDKLVIINPSLIEKLTYRKINYRFQKIYKMLMELINNDDDSDGTNGVSGFFEVLNETTKLKQELITKYNKNLKQDQLDILIKKLDIMAYQTKIHINNLKSKNDVREEKFDQKIIPLRRMIDNYLYNDEEEYKEEGRHR